MARNKTYCSPDVQARRTLYLAMDWTKQIAPYVSMLPCAWDTNYSKEAWAAAVFKAKNTEGQKYKRSIAEQLPHLWGDELFELAYWSVGRARKNTKHLIQGDLVLVLINNGTDRLPIFCASTKGKSITAYYYDTDRLGTPAEIEMFGFPGELAGRKLADPDAQAFMFSLRAGLGPQLGRRE